MFLFVGDQVHRIATKLYHNQLSVSELVENVKS